MIKRIVTLIACLMLAATAFAEPRYLNMHGPSEPETMDPNLATGNVEFNIMHALFEGLTVYNTKTLEATPAVAEKWTISPDGRIYTFTIRKDAKWSDGKPVTAADFVYSWERTLNPATASKYASMLYIVKNGEAYNMGKIKDAKQLGVKAKDPQTLVVELAYPAPYFLYQTSFKTLFPIPKHVVEKHGTAWTRQENIVGNGPFVMKNWTPNKQISAAKSPTYWDAANVKLPGVNFVVTEDNDTAVKMFDAQQLDIVWNVPVSKTPLLNKTPSYRLNPYLATYYYWFNTSNPKLKDARVRKALSLAIDRQNLVGEFLNNVHVANGNITPPGLPNYTQPTGDSFNPALAKQLMQQAGVKPEELTVEILYNTDDRHKVVAQVIQQMWKNNLGVNATLRNEEWKVYLNTQRQMNFEMSRAGWVGDYIDPMTFLDMFTSNSALNYSNWKNPQFDALISQAQNEPNTQKRAQILAQAEKMVLDSTVIMPIYLNRKDSLVRSYVKGFDGNLLDVHPWKFVSIDGNAPAAPIALPMWQQVQQMVKRDS